MPLIDLPDFAADLLGLFAAFSTERVDTTVIQPAEPFLDMAGEDLRRRIFMTESETGKSLCLRPEFTIPVCLHHIEVATGTPRRYAYLGQVFRQRRDGSNEFYQAGIEDLGDPDLAHADARAIHEAHAILKVLLPETRLAVVIGDQAVFEAVVAALGLPSGWQKRLIHAFGQSSQLEALLRRLARPEAVSGLDDVVEAFLARGDDEGLIRHIDETMQETGYSTNASRLPSEIARRLKEKMALAGASLGPAELDVLRSFLSLEVSLAEAPRALAGFAAKAGLTLDGAVERFEARVSALADFGMDLSALTWRAAFGRPLDYYTGLVFEITDGGKGQALAGGGRFDRMLTLLGAENHIPAVGFALWLDRIAASRGKA
jgi:ATP phosphoribosyltransferase regulatory subunit